MQYKTQIKGITHSAVDCFITFASRISSTYYSRVHISWNEVFSKILKKPSIVQK